MKKSKIISLLLICAMIISMASTAAATGFEQEITRGSIEGRLADIINGSLDEFNETEAVTAQEFSLNIDGNTATLSLTILEDDYTFSILLLPSHLAAYDGEAAVGVESGEGNLISFRIEKNAKLIGLMPNCEHLEGETVLYLGIEDAAEEQLYYFQIALPDLNIDTVLADVEELYNENSYTPEEIERIEVAYLTLSMAKNVDPNRKTEFISEITFNQEDGNISSENAVDTLSIGISELKEKSAEGFVKMDSPSARSLIYGVPDDVYKSGEFDEWIRRWNGWEAKTGYAVYPMSYGLSNNGRLHYVMTYSISPYINWNTQTFDISFKITQNCWVLYLIESNELMIFDSRARVAADPEVFYSSQTDTGVFIRRYYTITKADTLIDRATKFVIGYIPYVSDAVNLYETLSGSGDLTANKWYPFTETYAGQVAENKIIKKVTVHAEGLKQIDDYLYLQLIGVGINSVNYGYNYSVYDPVWW